MLVHQRPAGFGAGPELEEGYRWVDARRDEGRRPEPHCEGPGPKDPPQLRRMRVVTRGSQPLIRGIVLTAASYDVRRAPGGGVQALALSRNEVRVNSPTVT